MPVVPLLIPQQPFNPKLRIGEVYRLLSHKGASSSAVQPGKYFTVTHDCIVYLSGALGYDNRLRLEQESWEYTVVTLKEVQDV